MHSSLELGNKAIVGAGCLVAAACSLGDKTSVKRSVIGADCKCVHPQCPTLLRIFDLLCTKISKFAMQFAFVALVHSSVGVILYRAQGDQIHIYSACPEPRSGPWCRIGANVKILNSVLLDGCNIADGVHIQGSIVGFGVTVGAKAQLRDCRVGPKVRVPENADHRDEDLTESLS